MACCLAAPSLVGAKPLPEQVEGPVIWNVMTAMLRHCNNNAISVLQMITSPVREGGCLVGSGDGLSPVRR